MLVAVLVDAVTLVGVVGAVVSVVGGEGELLGGGELLDGGGVVASHAAVVTESVDAGPASPDPSIPATEYTYFVPHVLPPSLHEFV